MFAKTQFLGYLSVNYLTMVLEMQNLGFHFYLLLFLIEEVGLFKTFKI